MSDSIADMLTRIRNASIVFKKEVSIPYSKQKENIAKILVKEGYLNNFKCHLPAGESNVKKSKIKTIVCELKYQGKEPRIIGIQRVSRPGLRTYVSHKKLPRVFSGLGIALISTPKGILTNKEAKRQKLGGEVICKVW